MDRERRGFQIVVSSGQPDAHGPRPGSPFWRVKAVLVALLVGSIFIGFLIAAFLIGSIVAVVLIVVAGVAMTIALFKAATRSVRRHL